MVSPWYPLLPQQPPLLSQHWSFVICLFTPLAHCPLICSLVSWPSPPLEGKLREGRDFGWLAFCFIASLWQSCRQGQVAQHDTQECLEQRSLEKSPGERSRCADPHCALHSGAALPARARLQIRPGRTTLTFQLCGLFNCLVSLCTCPSPSMMTGKDAGALQHGGIAWVWSHDLGLSPMIYYCNSIMRKAWDRVCHFRVFRWGRIGLLCGMVGWWW